MTHGETGQMADIHDKDNDDDDVPLLLLTSFFSCSSGGLDGRLLV